MDIGNTKVAIGLAVKVFDDFLKELHHREKIPQALRFESEFNLLEGMPIKGIVLMELEPPGFKMRWYDSGAPYTGLDLRGNIKIMVASDKVQSPPLYSFPFYVELITDLVLKYQTGKAPVLGMHYGGIGALDAPLSKEFLEQNLAGSDILKLINEIELDVVKPIIQSMEAIYYFNNPSKPTYDQYQALLRLMPGDSGHFDAIGLFIDLPGMGTMVSNVDSFVPKSSELMIWFTRSLVELMVEKGKSEMQSWISGFQGGLEVTKLDLTLEDNRIYLDAKVVSHDYDAEGTIKGPIYLLHMPGRTYMHVDSQLDIDIDLPWWADILVFFTGTSDIVHEKLPNMGQKMAEDMANNMLDKLASAISLENISIDGVPVEVYPDHMALESGAIKLYIQILTHKISENILRADYSRLRRRFVMVHLESGRRFMAEDLARLVYYGFIEVPGYHQVRLRYMRANPDSKESNNLLERFGRR